jgi:hypothetical protein
MPEPVEGFLHLTVRCSRAGIRMQRMRKNLRERGGQPRAGQADRIHTDIPDTPLPAAGAVFLLLA